MRKTVVVAIVVVVVIGASIGVYALRGKLYNKTSPNTPSNMTNMDMNSSSTSSSSSTQETTNAVTIDNSAFNPAAITVKKGTTVTWTNKDSTVHTVTETDGQDGPKSDALDTGKSYSFTFNTVGTFKYACSIHPSMTGSVTVTE